MFTQCPRCLAIYELDPATLAQAHGMVGCGQCGATFNALATLVERLPEDCDVGLPIHPTDPAAPILMEPVSQLSGLTREDVEAADDDAQPATAPADADSVARSRGPGGVQRRVEPFVSATGVAQAIHAQAIENQAIDDRGDHRQRNAPSFVGPRSATVQRRHTGWWVLGCVVLALLLAAQLGWAERRALVANPDTRPWLARTCAWLGCRLPAVSDPSRIMLLSRDVRSYPPDGALLISAAIRNQAPFRQPYPVIAVTLSDRNGTPIAMRRFRPSAYITDTHTRDAGLEPGATAAVRFEVKAPAHQATSFQFAFY